jgi:hypothetical protein
VSYRRNKRRKLIRTKARLRIYGVQALEPGQRKLLGITKAPEGNA